MKHKNTKQTSYLSSTNKQPLKQKRVHVAGGQLERLRDRAGIGSEGEVKINYRIPLPIQLQNNVVQQRPADRS